METLTLRVNTTRLIQLSHSSWHPSSEYTGVNINKQVSWYHAVATATNATFAKHMQILCLNHIAPYSPYKRWDFYVFLITWKQLNNALALPTEYVIWVTYCISIH